MGYLLAVILIFGLAGLAVIVYLSRKAPVVVAILTIPVGLIGLLIGVNCRYSDIETIANFFFPPDDIEEQGIEILLSETSTVYSLTFLHKYPGNHFIGITIPSGYKHVTDKEGKAMLRMHYKIFDGSKLVHEELYKEGYPLWGIHKIYCFSYWEYKVPKDLPRSIPLRFEVSLLGDIASFLAENKRAKLVIGKVSDE